MNPHGGGNILKSKSTSICPECGQSDFAFHTICPECGPPFTHDYVYTQIHPRDPNTPGIFSGQRWVRVVPACTLFGPGLYLPGAFEFLQECADKEPVNEKRSSKENRIIYSHTLMLPVPCTSAITRTAWSRRQRGE